MDLIDRLREIAANIDKVRHQLQTEEATKNALVMPFINALGYNVFDPGEVVPEFTADVGTKKGEKVDYAIMRNGSPILLFECKTVGRNLDKETPTQLYRYFSVTPARFSVLTNGIEYRFYSDLEEPNKMDHRPFFEFSLLDLNERAVEELKKFSKSSFDLENILETASDLKYTKAIKRLLRDEWINPSEEFVRLFTGRVYSGRVTQAVRDQFAAITKKAFHEFVAERINERLKSALEHDLVVSADGPDPIASNGTDDGGSGDVVTTEEELDGFYVVKSIVREVVDPSRIFLRDTKSYCGILLDDNNRKPICRLRFNYSQKYLGLFDREKNEVRESIQGVNAIYRFAEQLKQTVRRMDSLAASGDNSADASSASDS